MNKLVAIVKSLHNSVDARRVAGNFIWLSALQIANYIFPLITMPYLAKVIGVDGFGKIGLAAAIMVWIQAIADWGFNMTATRDVAQNKDNKEVVSHILSNVLWARFILMICSFVILVVLVLIIPRFREEWMVILATFLMIPGHILFADWFFVAIEKMKYITILNVLMKLIFTVAIFVFIKQPEDYILQPLFTSFGYVVSGTIALYYIIYKWGYGVYKPNIKETFTTIKNSTDVFINQLMPNLYNSFSTMLLGIFGGGYAVGILDGGSKFIRIGIQLQMTLSRTFFPFLSRNIEKHQLFKRINISISFIACLLLFCGAPLLVNIMLSPEFYSSISVIRIKAIGLFFNCICSIYGTNYLIIKHKERTVRKITVYCSIAGFIMSWPLVYFYSYIGASLTVTLSLALLAISTYIAARKTK